MKRYFFIIYFFNYDTMSRISRKIIRVKKSTEIASVKKEENLKQMNVLNSR